jgi:hypothetical protein
LWFFFLFPKVSAEKKVIQITGSNPYYTGVSFTEEYDDQGAHCSSHARFDANLDAILAVGGDVVDLQKPGTYKVKYFCGAHPAVSSTRMVIVDEKYSAKCTELTISGSATGVDGQYRLVPSETHDGAPIYRRVNTSVFSPLFVLIHFLRVVCCAEGCGK